MAALFYTLGVEWDSTPNQPSNLPPIGPTHPPHQLDPPSTCSHQQPGYNHEREPRAARSAASASRCVVASAALAGSTGRRGVGRKRSGGVRRWRRNRCRAHGGRLNRVRRAQGRRRRRAQRPAWSRAGAARGAQPRGICSSTRTIGEHGQRQKQRHGGLPRATGSGCCERSRDVPGAVAV